MEENQTGLTDDRHNDVARKVVREVGEFTTKLEERAGTHAGKVISDSEQMLDGRIIEQKPEEFISRELIEPVGEALGYELRSQPKGIDGLDGRMPDFTILNLEVENLCEVKTPGGITEARSESFDYLQRATERPLVGIATDGLTWILHTADEGEQPMYTRHERLYPVVRKIRREEAYERRDRYPRPELREEILSFIDAFHIDSLEETV